MKRELSVAQKVRSSSSKVLNRSFLFKPCPSKMVMPSWRVVSNAAAMASAPKAFSIVICLRRFHVIAERCAGIVAVRLGRYNQCDYLRFDRGSNDGGEGFDGFLLCYLLRRSRASDMRLSL